MTRQQEGDEVAKIPRRDGLCWWGWGNGECMNPQTGNGFYCKEHEYPILPKPEEETKLPALEMMRSEESHEWEALKCRERQLLAALRDLKTVLDRESASTVRFDAEITALEKSLHQARAEWNEEKQRAFELIAERDSLKDEIEKWKSHRTAWVQRAEKAERRLSAYNSGGFADADAMAEKYLDAVNELSTLKAQLDAVVGQETPQSAWERGFEEGIGAAIAQVQTSVNLHPQTKLEMFLLESPPYTPPLKAGK